MSSRINASHHVSANQYEPGISDSSQADQHVLEFHFLNITPYFNFFVSPSWDIGLEIPLRMVSIDAAFLGFAGEALDDFESIHHRTEILQGLTDVPVDVGWTLQSPLPVGHQLKLRLGATLPFGRTEPNPFALGQAGREHQHIFFGTGTVNPIAAVSYVLPVRQHRLFLFSEGQLAFYQNNYDYQGPSILTSGASFNYTVSPSVQARATLIAYQEWSAKWSGQNARNSGRLDAIPGLGVRWQFEEGLGVGLAMQFPVNIAAAGGQIQMPWLLSLNMDFTGQMFQDNF